MVAGDVHAGQRLVSGEKKFVDLEVVLHYQNDRAVLMSLDGPEEKHQRAPWSDARNAIA